jgi:periplasmic copper chaperone A
MQIFHIRHVQKDHQMIKRTTLFFAGLLLVASSHLHASILAVSDSWARAGRPNSAAFMKIKNTSTEDRKIVSAETESAQYVELHDHIQEGDVMKMRKVNDLVIPAGGEVELMPGGKHLMLFGLGHGLESGQAIKIKLTLDNEATMNIEVPVKPMTYNPKLKGCNCNK